MELSPYNILNSLSSTNCYKLYSYLKSFSINGPVICKQYVNKHKEGKFKSRKYNYN